MQLLLVVITVLAVAAYTAAGQQVECAAPLPTISGGVFSPLCRRPVGGVCHAVCDADHDSQPRPGVTCLSNGTWSAPSARCDKVCRGIPWAPLPGGKWPRSCRNTRHFGWCEGVCDPGWTGSPKVLCRHTWQGDKVIGKCVQPPQPGCSGDPANPPNGHFSCSLQTSSGSSCMATCDPGYQGSPSVLCTAGSWGSVSGACTLAPASSPSPSPTPSPSPSPSPVCPGRPPDPANGALACGPTQPGETCTATCAAGYEGSPTSLCATDGTWGSVQNTCARASCRIVPAIPTGAFQCGSATAYGSSCTATCNSGYVGTAKVVCGEGARFGPVNGTCNPLGDCASNPCGSIVDSTGVCVANADGSYTCACAPGFSWTGAGCAASVPLPAYTSYDNLVYLTTAELAPGPGTGCGAKASSKDACALRCAATPYCKVFVYVGAGCSGSCCQACYLKYSVDLTYVYTPQPVAEKYSVGIMPVTVANETGLVGKDIAENNFDGGLGCLKTNTSSAQTCAGWCAKTAGCPAYTWVPVWPSTLPCLPGACFLKNALRPMADANADLPGIVSSYVTGVAAVFSHLANLALSDPTIAGVNPCTAASTYEDCASLCAHTAGCVAFTFQKNGSSCSNACYLKATANGRQGQDTALGSMTGLKVPTTPDGSLSCPVGMSYSPVAAICTASA